MEESIDPKDRLENECARSSSCKPLLQRLVRCNARVNANQPTEETCMEELIDLSACVDKCVSPKLFSYLK